MSPLLLPLGACRGSNPYIVTHRSLGGVFPCDCARFILTALEENVFDSVGLLSAPLHSVTHSFFSPLEALLPQCQNLRGCPALPDTLWLQLGIERVLYELPSGRAFLQQHAWRFTGARGSRHGREGRRGATARSYRQPQEARPGDPARILGFPKRVKVR